MLDIQVITVDEVLLQDFKRKFTRFKRKITLVRIILAGLFVMMFTLSAFDAFINMGRYAPPVQLRINLIFTITIIAFTSLSFIAVKYNLGFFAVFAYPAAIFSIIDEHNILVLVMNMILALAMFEIATVTGFFDKTVKNYADNKRVHELGRASHVFDATIVHMVSVFTGLLFISWTIAILMDLLAFSFGAKFESTLAVIVLAPVMIYILYITIFKDAKPAKYEKHEYEYARSLGKEHHKARKKRTR